MPVAIRKRRWEEHVTHASGLQYSYDDLDLVCRHGVQSEGPRVAAGSSKQGRRTRCASMPEGCHRLPPQDSVVCDHTASEQSKVTGGDVKADVVIPRRAEGRDGGMENAKKTADGENVTESSVSPNVCDDDGVFKSPHISREGQQCISISSNNGPLLSRSAVEPPGKPPNHQETKESHTEGYSRPPEISEAALNRFSAAELEPQTDPPDAGEEKISTFGHADASVAVRVGVLHSPVNMMERRDGMSPADETVETAAALAVEASGDKGVTESRSAEAAVEPDGLNDPETVNGNAGLHSRGPLGVEQDHHRRAEDSRQAGGCETPRQVLLELHDVEMMARSAPREEESAQAHGGEEAAAEVRGEPTAPSGTSLDGQRRPAVVSGDVSSEEPDGGYSGGNRVLTNVTQCADRCEETTTSVSQPVGNKELACGDHVTENSCSKADATQRGGPGGPEDTTALEPQNNTDSVLNSKNPHVQRPRVDVKHAGSPPSSKEVNRDLSPGGLHGNQAPGSHLGESPAAEVADGRGEQQRPGATVSVLSPPGMEEPGEAAGGAVFPGKQPAAPVLEGAKDPADPNEDGVVQVRMRKSTSTIPVTEKAEIEAKEACTWLWAAGFPQYAQLYEDAQFPIDISSVTRDHDFLERDAIEALCRRLNTLNKCALMRLEISPQRKRSEDSDEDEPCAISGRWTFQRDSKRWSRMDELEVFSSLPADAAPPPFPKDHPSQKSKLALREANSSESMLTDLSELPEVGSIHSSGSRGRGGGEEEQEKSHAAALANEAGAAGATRASSVASMCSSSGTGGSGCVNEDSLSDGMPPSPLETLGQFTFDVKTATGGPGGSLDREDGGSKSTRSRAKSFLKRMESLRLRSGTSSKRKKKGSASGGKIEISGPVIKEGLDDDKLRRLNCVDISSINLNQNLNHHRIPAQTMTLNRNRSVSYSTQTSNGSTGSTGSSHSEASSGSAVSTPSPVTRARSHSIAAGSSKRGGMYLEGFDPFSVPQHASDGLLTTPPKSAPPIPCQAGKGMTVDEQNRRNNRAARDDIRRAAAAAAEEEGEEEEEVGEDGTIFFFLPEGHKPGTFPTALQDGSSRTSNGNDNGNSVILRGRQSSRQRQCSSGSVDSRLSFYDNVPYAEREEGAEEEEEEEGDEHKLEQVLQHVSGLQRFVNAWSEAVAGEEEEEEEEEEEDDDDEEEEEGDSDSALDSASPCPSSPLQNRLEETENGSDQDSTGNPLGEGEEGMRERRDSGVGASLTRTSRPQKLRWPSFQNSHRPSLASAQLQISCQSVLQMNLLQKFSLLQLTALLERHTPTNKHGFSWAVPKFMKRIKVRDYKDRNVFGVPLQVIVQRSGQPLPQGIQQAMRYLRNQCLDQVGLFRKSGVKSRIQALRLMNEASGVDGGGVNYEGQSAYDVADMLKQYFRDLPEPLLTSKLSETFLQIYQYMPKELRLQAARAAVVLLPDENREALRTLLCLLSDVTASVSENQMTPTNLAVCLAPSLFHLNTLRRKESSSPRVMNRKQTLGKPDQRDLNENLAATHGLAHMIQECSKLFRIPEEMNRCRNSYVEQALLPGRLEDLTGEEAVQGGYRAYLKDSLDALLKDAKDKFKGYDSCSTPEHAELSCKKVHDGFPLRLWKVTVEVPASPEEVLTRLLREQGYWDEDLLESRVVETLDERTEVYQYVRNTMAPHPTRDHLVLRTWVTDLPKGACALVCRSVDHEGARVVGVRTNVLTSRYFIEPCGSNKSRLTHISRNDCRGRFPEWYNKLYGQLCAAEVARIRDSFNVPMDK
uniref:Rho GTPase-activating protein 7 n=1 Tax=Gasterosteus aculeatus aculeatus TaxID=481459 RepID=A0AAQ4QQC1_GASAC